jgi:hypothetical protein
MMDVASPASLPIPSHFAPPARTQSTRRRLYHQPTLHMRPGTVYFPRPSEGDGPSPPSSAPQQTATLSSQSVIQQQLKRASVGPPASPRTQSFSSNPQPAYEHPNSLQRKSTGSSNTSLTPSVGPLIPTSHSFTRHRHTGSTSTSNSSIHRNPSGHSNYRYPSLTPPLSYTRPMSTSNGDTYVARLRRAKATVWSARGQREDLDRSNSNLKDDKARKYAKQKIATARVHPCLFLLTIRTN